MKKAILFFTVVCSVIIQTSYTQETFPVQGISNPNPNIYAFTNAHIFIDYQTEIDGTILIKEGKILAVGADIKVPAGAQKIDLKGKYIYPSFIDPFSDYGMPSKKKPKNQERGPHFERDTKAPVAWNDALKPYIQFSEKFSVKNKQANDYRKAGFGAVITHQKDGIIRGISATVLLGDENENLQLLKSKTALQLSFNKGSSQQDYPGSLMGAIALLRQTYLDAFWYANNTRKKERNIALEAFIEAQNLPQIFEVNSYQSLLRADKIGDEFGVQYIIKGAGDEYKRIEEIKNTQAALIIPVNFPKPYEVTDPFDADMITLSQLKHWETAPFNPVILEKNQIDFAFTADGLKDKSKFLDNVRIAVSKGLSKTTALKALTHNPALIIGEDVKIGKLEKGYIANLLVTSGDIFDNETIIYENIIRGKRFRYRDIHFTDIRGKYDLNVNGKVYEMTVFGDAEKPSAKIKMDTTELKAALQSRLNLIALSFTIDTGTVRLSGKINYNSGIWDGKGQLASGKWIEWNAIRKEKHQENKSQTPTKQDTLIPAVFFPNMAYGWDTLPKPQTYLIKNATVWTCEQEGILKNTDILIEEGKISRIATNIAPQPNTIVIDAKGKHVTPGIIDEHSHIAISGGVNECTEAITSEVRIGDVINPDDINIYRQLAGGVTTAQLLHGSCNPIGGQSAIIKLRWGRGAEAMKMQDAPGFIKFALGENVKRANFGDAYTKRFPQTRMGVEQIYYDAFYRAKAYQTEWEQYSAKQTKKKKSFSNIPRKDLELEALSEILNNQRFITCHSYQQGEINMLMHVADSMGFKINTFTHVLEGYKIADKIRKHGAAASTFSDWWAYKYEVNDAIPYNGAILWKHGVVTGFNSDDAEMGRRLNQEAAKAIKYGNVPPEEALKFVTLNPAKMLHIDHKTGSIKEGKDADLVIWSHEPLSILAKAEKTFVDGILYFDIERDKQQRKLIQKERNRIIQKMLQAKPAGASTQKPRPKHHHLYKCNTVIDYQTYEN